MHPKFSVVSNEVAADLISAQRKPSLAFVQILISFFFPFWEICFLESKLLFSSLLVAPIRERNNDQENVIKESNKNYYIKDLFFFNSMYKRCLLYYFSPHIGNILARLLYNMRKHISDFRLTFKRTYFSN